MFNAAKNLIKRFSREDSGSATVEAVLWIPVFVMFMVLAVDASFLFFGQNKAHRIVQDVNRQYSVGWHADATEVRDAILARLSVMAPSATAGDISVTTGVGGVITTTVSLDASDLVAVGSFTSLMDATVFVTSTHMVEN